MTLTTDCNVIGCGHPIEDHEQFGFCVHGGCTCKWWAGK